MATISPTSVTIAKGVLKTTWTLTATADTCLPLNAPTYPDKTVQWGGTQNNAAVAVAGSSNTATGPYVIMNTASGAALQNAAGAAKLAVALQNPQWIRPQYVTATAAGTRALTVTIISQSTRR